MKILPAGLKNIVNWITSSRNAKKMVIVDAKQEKLVSVGREQFKALMKKGLEVPILPL